VNRISVLFMGTKKWNLTTKSQTHMLHADSKQEIIVSHYIGLHWVTLCITVYVKLCIVDLVYQCVDSNFNWSINQIKSNRLYSFSKNFDIPYKKTQGRQKQFDSGRAHGERGSTSLYWGLWAELVRGALPLKLKAFSHLDVQWKRQNLLPAVLTVYGTVRINCL